MKTEEWFIHIMEWQKYKGNTKRQKQKKPSPSYGLADSLHKADDYSQTDSLLKADNYSQADDQYRE
jgi:hypothetical protein